MEGRFKMEDPKFIYLSPCYPVIDRLWSEDPINTCDGNCDRLDCSQDKPWIKYVLCEERLSKYENYLSKQKLKNLNLGITEAKKYA